MESGFDPNWTFEFPDLSFARSDKTPAGFFSSLGRGLVEPASAAIKSSKITSSTDAALANLLQEEFIRSTRTPEPTALGKAGRFIGGLGGSIGEFIGAAGVGGVVGGPVGAVVGGAGAMGATGAWESFLNAGIRAMQQGMSAEQAVPLAKKAAAIGGGVSAVTAAALPGAGYKVVGRPLSRLAVESAIGAGLGAGGTAAQNVAMQQLGLNVPTMEGVPESALTMGLIPPAMHFVRGALGFRESPQNVPLGLKPLGWMPEQANVPVATSTPVPVPGPATVQPTSLSRFQRFSRALPEYTGPTRQLNMPPVPGTFEMGRTPIQYTWPERPAPIGEVVPIPLMEQRFGGLSRFRQAPPTPGLSRYASPIRSDQAKLPQAGPVPEEIQGVGRPNVPEAEPGQGIPAPPREAEVPKVEPVLTPPTEAPAPAPAPAPTPKPAPGPGDAILPLKPGTSASGWVDQQNRPVKWIPAPEKWAGAMKVVLDEQAAPAPAAEPAPAPAQKKIPEVKPAEGGDLRGKVQEKEGAQVAAPTAPVPTAPEPAPGKISKVEEPLKTWDTSDAAAPQVDTALNSWFAVREGRQGLLLDLLNHIQRNASDRLSPLTMALLNRITELSPNTTVEMIGYDAALKRWPALDREINPLTGAIHLAVPPCPRRGRRESHWSDVPSPIDGPE